MTAMRAVVVLSALVLAGCQDASSPEAGSPLFARGGVSGPAASGHVERVFPGVTEVYSFTAQVVGNGAVKGRFQVRDVYDDGVTVLREMGEIHCLVVEADGRTARIGGLVTQGSESFAGTFTAQTVRDNGEGAGSPPDEATDLRYGVSQAASAFHCASGLNLGTFGVSTQGNIQVRP